MVKKMPKKTLKEIELELEQKVASEEITPEEAEQEYYDRLEWDYDRRII